MKITIYISSKQNELYNLTIMDDIFVIFTSFLLFFRFFLASFYTKYDKVHFLINAAFCGLSVIAKLPMFHGKRFFEINKW